MEEDNKFVKVNNSDNLKDEIERLKGLLARFKEQKNALQKLSDLKRQRKVELAEKLNKLREQLEAFSERMPVIHESKHEKELYGIKKDFEGIEREFKKMGSE